ncbi:IGSF6 protein, partial [Atractosteus spatula]|nr:IGSF6 protein [Atractosteus spatula]
MSAVEDASSVTIPCSVTAPGCPGDQSVYWFVFRASSHERLHLHAHSKYALQGDSLDISPVHANDSGVYYCGIAFSGSTGARSTGKGTVLLVRGSLHVANPQGKALLSTVIVLLFLYNLAIIILLIHKKVSSLLRDPARERCLWGKAAPRKKKKKAILSPVSLQCS